MKDIQQLIALLFLSRDVAHKAHLNSDSFSEHMTLGAFYDSVIELADKLSEAWMGRNLKKIGDIPVLKSPNGEIIDVLKRHLEVIEDTRDFLKDDTALQNIVDEIVALYLSTLYKLKFLK
jgi:hypothetical protein